MADNTNTASSADTSSVTAIKVKVVLDTTTEELKNQFKGVQNSFKKAPVEIAFGVNEGATIGNVNAALKRIIKKVESPKLTLKIDESNIDAAVKKAVNKAQSGAKNTKTEVKVNLNTNEAKQKLDAFYRRVQEKGSLYKDALKLESSGKNQPELEEVLRQLQAVRNEAGRLRAELVNILPTEEFSKISEIERATTNSISRLDARLQGLKNAANNDALRALKKSQSDQTNTYSNNLADANNKYKNYSGASDVKSSLADVQKQIDILNTLEIGTQDYADQLNVVADTWTDATRQMSAFDEAQKKTENHVKSMTEQALKWKESIKDSDTASQELRDSIDGIIDASKKLDSDHSSDAYKQGVKYLDDAFISAKASMSVYTDGYKDLESTARRTLTEIRKKELELEQAGNHSFDSILIGDSKTDSLDGSLESQLNSLKGMNTQSATYKQRVSEIVDEWLKVKIQIEQALKSEEDLEKEAAKRQNQIRSQQKAYNSIMKTLGTADFTDKDSKTKAFFETSVNNDTKRTGAQAVAELQSEMAKLSETQPPAEYEQTLKNIKDLVVEINKQINEARNSSSNARADNTKNNHMQDLMRELYSYREKLIGFEGNQKLSEEYENLFNAIKTGSFSFDEAQLKVSAFKNACHNAGLETETLGQKLSRLFKEHFQTAIAMAGVAMVKQGLREVYNNVLELDTAVTELKKVSSMTGDEMNSYLERTATNARELGASISDLVTSTADWKRLGYSDEDSEELARVAALMANVGDGIDNATTASSYLISTMQGFGLVADDAEHLLDCMNQIANTEPVSMEDLGIIMQKSSAAMSAAGNTYQETLAMASALNGVLQDSESSGTYMKTLSMYLRASKTDAEEAGIATDGMASSVSELRSELKQLAGVDIMKNDNTFKSTYQIMKELSEVWKDLSDTTQANITELISGKRGGQGTSALLNNFSVAEDAMKQALNSSGSVMRENETHMQSLQAKLNQLDSAFQKFSTDLMSSEIPKFFVDLATIFVDGADSAVKFAGALPTLTAAISGVLSVMQMSGKLKNGAGKVNMPSYTCCV